MRTKRGVAAALVLLMGLLMAGCTSPPTSESVEVAPSTSPTQSAGAPAASTATQWASPTLMASTETPPPPTPTRRPTSTPGVTATEEVRTVTFTIVYDNNTYDSEPTLTPALQELRTSWGFACWVETEETTVLFDTGGDGATLMHNMTELGLDLQAIDAVVLSHIHGDHTGGLGALLGTGVRPTVYVPASFPGAFKRDVQRLTDLVEVRGTETVAPGIYTTGEVGSGIIEQALAVETEGGLVVVTGCAHPGVVEMVRHAKIGVAQALGMDDQVALVMGGFHLGGASRARVQGIIADFRDLGVQRVAPCHCTGDAARQMFAEAFGDDCVLPGVGWSTEMAVRE